jgi:hypothetical protein
MGKLKEKMLNNNNEEDNQFELSAFEYVELMSKYKDSVQEEYVPTEEDMKKLDEMLAEYYNSKEFREYVENYQPNDESLQELEDDFFERWTSDDIDAALAEHNAHEEGFDLDSINDSMNLKYTDDDVINAIKKINNEQWLIDGIMMALNDTWNQKNGLN